MYLIGKYKPTDRMSELICNNYHTLLVLSRFNIPLGFGDKSIIEICNDNNVDSDTFLAVINILINEENILSSTDLNSISIKSLVVYLKNSHAYFLDFRLPSIRRKLIEAIDYGGIISEETKHRVFSKADKSTNIIIHA